VHAVGLFHRRRRHDRVEWSSLPVDLAMPHPACLPLGQPALLDWRDAGDMCVGSGFNDDEREDIELSICVRMCDLPPFFLSGGNVMLLHCSTEKKEGGSVYFYQ